MMMMMMMMMMMNAKMISFYLFFFLFLQEMRCDEYDRWHNFDYLNGLSHLNVWYINFHGLLTGCSLPYSLWPSDCFACSNDFTKGSTGWFVHPLSDVSVKDEITLPRLRVGVDFGKGDKSPPLLLVTSTPSD